MFVLWWYPVVVRLVFVVHLLCVVVVGDTGRWSSPFQGYSYAAPRLDTIQGENTGLGCQPDTNFPNQSLIYCARDGGEKITLKGSNFGSFVTPPAVLVGGEMCINLIQKSGAAAHTEVTCTLPRGSTLALSVILIQQNALSSNALTVSYLPCQEGEYVTGDVLQPCGVCVAGSYSSTKGSWTCRLCAAGTISANHSSTCTACARGTYAAAKGSSVCMDCQPGEYADTTGSIVCRACAAGSFSRLKSASTCELCAAGTYTASPGASVCVECSSGLRVQLLCVSTLRSLQFRSGLFTNAYSQSAYVIHEFQPRCRLLRGERGSLHVCQVCEWAVLSDGMDGVSRLSEGTISFWETCELVRPLPGMNMRAWLLCLLYATRVAFPMVMCLCLCFLLVNSYCCFVFLLQ